MAHTKQQRKRIRQDTVRNTANTAARTKLRGTVKTLETTISAGKKEGVADAFKAAMSQLAKSARKGIISKGAAARKVSRMAARIKAMAAK